MKRFVGSLTLALVAVALFVLPATAGRQWCYVDPVVTLNGTAVQILVAVPEEYVPAVTGAIDFEISVPEGVSHEVDFLDAGFNGYGETVSIQTLSGATVAQDGSFEISIRAQVPVDASVPDGVIPVQVVVITNGDLTWSGGIPWVVNGEETVVEGNSSATYVNVTVQGSN